ncbi:unnamed protein product [Ilex paraguariensis]|uniref:Uncharacterized protein n=1 Tax=Ilex paraguariensis TaxID=185542 RepID=A0ABC8TI15_9AQUA
MFISLSLVFSSVGKEIKVYADNYSEQHTDHKDSGTETMKFFLNCLSLLLGRLDVKQFDNAMAEYAPKISQVLISQVAVLQFI